MIRGIYTASSGLISHSKSLDVTGNNIANARTAGFKSSQLTTRSFDEQMALRMGGGTSQNTARLGSITLGRQADGVFTSSEQGTLEQTGRTLDFAIAGDGLFTIERADGTRAFTRNGEFSLDQEGFLYSPLGGRVLGMKGPVQVGGADLQINNAGEISVNGSVIDRLNIYSPANINNLAKFGEGIFVETTPNGGGTTPFNGKILQGTIEGSNVDVGKEMTNMMAASRGFQSCSQVIKMLDQISEKTVTEIGSL